MSTFEKQLSRYAELAVKVGVNIQPNQYLISVLQQKQPNLLGL